MSVTSLIALFGAGVASFLAPCVLPLVPAWIAMAGADSGEADRPTLVRSTALFITGFTTVFMLAGVGVGAVGGIVRSEAVSRVGGVVVVLFGVALLVDRIGYRIPTVQTAAHAGSRHRSLRALALGVSFGASWTPCVGPLLGTALVVASAEGGAARGAVFLGVYALGLGLPFLVTSLALTSSTRLLRRIARHADAVRKVGGIALVVLGVALVTGRYDALIGPIASVRAR
ncbi:MAG: cytochrome c biogenesis CcdA family protein [Acidimicrobiia bacterium]